MLLAKGGCNGAGACIAPVFSTWGPRRWVMKPAVRGNPREVIGRGAESECFIAIETLTATMDVCAEMLLQGHPLFTL
jgi:hypothetical protein